MLNTSIVGPSLDRLRRLLVENIIVSHWVEFEMKLRSEVIAERESWLHIMAQFDKCACSYVGALPGAFVQGLRKVGVSNPLFLLDELDKSKSTTTLLSQADVKR